MKQTYDVTRQHLGDRMYLPGDQREADPSDVKHLVDTGVLTLRAEKAERPVDNKAIKAPRNKAE